MGEKTNIAWTDATWNPTRGCSVISEGCKNCYAMALAHRFGGPGQPYEGLTEMRAGRPSWSGKIKFVQEKLDQPLRWTKPRRIFVNSVSDLFHEGIPFDYVEQVFKVMGASTRHTFQVLTKRPERMLEFCSDRNPASNIWLGVTVENQRAAEERIPVLSRVPATFRYLSCEPLLEGIDLTGLLGEISWLIVGGESGPRARPMKQEWVESLLEECREAGVKFFYKQKGEILARECGALSRKGESVEDFPLHLQVREYPI